MKIFKKWKENKYANRAEMLNDCLIFGRYIDTSYYDLESVDDCIQMINDAESNYNECEDDHKRINEDYYNEDYYIDYHYKAVSEKVLFQEIFWKKFIKEVDCCEHISQCDYGEKFLKKIEKYCKNFSPKFVEFVGLFSEFINHDYDRFALYLENENNVIYTWESINPYLYYHVTNCFPKCHNIGEWNGYYTDITSDHIDDFVNKLLIPKKEKEQLESLVSDNNITKRVKI